MRSLLRTLVLLIAGALSTGACDGSTSTSTSTSTSASRPSETGQPVPTAQSPSASIYPLHVALRDQNGAAIGSDVFSGHPVIVSMFYGSCPTACPLIVTHIKQIEASLPAPVRAETRVLLVSFDAERDTPERLRELARAHHVDTSRWRFAVGLDDEARLLANALGVNYRRGEGGVFSHDSVISVLDADGRIVARVDDPQGELTPLADAITRLVRF